MVLVVGAGQNAELTAQALIEPDEIGFQAGQYVQVPAPSPASL